MSFKIIQTHENGQKLLSIVPSAWEKNSILYWPPNHLTGRVIRDGNSIPGKGWKTQTAVIKRQGFLSYEAAEMEMEKMETKSDTEGTDSEMFKVTNLKKKRKIHGKRSEVGRTKQPDFNELAEECQNPVTAVFTSEKNCTVVADDGTVILKEFDLLNTTVASISLTDSLQQSTPQQRDDLHMIDKENLEPCNDLLYNNIIENQKKIIKELATQSTMIGLICETLSINANNLTDVLSNNKGPAISEIKYPLPLKEKEQVQLFELECLKEDYSQALITKMSAICGTSGKSVGLNCCYKLIDHFFERKLLTEFSWSGGCRNPENSKTAFKCFKRIMKIFFIIVKQADISFCEADNETFFKSIIKNATRRAKIEEQDSEKRRASSCKNRSKNLTYNKKSSNI